MLVSVRLHSQHAKVKERLPFSNGKMQCHHFVYFINQQYFCYSMQSLFLLIGFCCWGEKLLIYTFSPFYYDAM